MSYKVVALHSLEDADIVGYVILGEHKLKSTNVYSDSAEAKEDADKLNEAELLREHWPLPTDPEVAQLLNDPSFEPVEYEDVEVPDWEKSEIVYVMKPELFDGEYIDRVVMDPNGSPVVDWRASTVVYKTEKHPKRTDSRSRIDAACEHIARQRAGLTQV